MLTLSHVERYIKLGFIVHPCCPVKHDCNSPGKIPYNPYKRVHMERWQDHKQFHIADWESWLDMDSTINIGVLTGSPSGLLFIDIDSKEAENEFWRLQRRIQSSASNGKEASNGRVAQILETAKRDKGAAPEGNYWAFETGRGRRYIFRAKNGECGSFKRATGTGEYIEVLGDGRQSVLPPSLHTSGKRYRWIADHTPRSSSVDNAPTWCGRASTTSTEGTITSEKPDWTREVASPTAKGSRNENLTRLAGHLISPQPLPKSEVRLWLNAYNKAYCHPPLDTRELDGIIYSIFKREESQESKIRDIMNEFHCNREAAENYLIENPEIFR